MFYKEVCCVYLLLFIVIIINLIKELLPAGASEMQCTVEFPKNRQCSSRVLEVIGEKYKDKSNLSYINILIYI